MPRYFFHVRSPEGLSLDREGVDLPGMNAVHDEAIAGAQSIMASRLLDGKEPDHRAFEIETEDHQIVMTLPFREVLKLTPILVKPR